MSLTIAKRAELFRITQAKLSAIADAAAENNGKMYEALRAEVIDLEIALSQDALELCSNTILRLTHAKIALRQNVQPLNTFIQSGGKQ